MPRPRTKERKPGLTERQVMEQVVDYLRALGVDIDRQNTGGMTRKGKDDREHYIRFGRPGQCDLSGTLRDGRRLEIETKATGKLPRPEQMEHIRRINALNGVAFWCDNVDVVMRIMPLILKGWRVQYREDITKADILPPEQGG
jgi:hypothetical protein